MNHISKRILVTGASGFIGSHLCRKLLSEGNEVLAVNRSGAPVDGAVRTVPWQLGNLVPSDLPVCNVAVHLAHDFDGKSGAQKTVSGTKQLVDYLYAQGTRRQLFVTSYSAGTHSRSQYGKTKGALEEDLRKDTRTLIVRPGLVLGDGGIYGRIARLARQSPVVPLPGGGRGLVPVITIDRLCDEMAQLCVAQNPAQDANLFEPELVTLKHLVQTVASEAGRRPFLVSIPFALAIPVVQVLKVLGLPTLISSDSLIGFVDNQQAAHVSTLENADEPV